MSGDRPGRRPGGRGARAIGAITDELRYASRALRSRPLYCLAAILTLALGIGANSAIYSVVHTLLFRPLPYPEPEQLVQVWDSRPEEGVPRWGVSLHDFEDWRERNRVFSALAAYVTREGNLSGAEKPVRASYALVTPGLFAVLGVEPMLGRVFLPHENDPGRDRVAILGYQLWQRQLGGDPRVLGTELVLDEVPLTVVGVLPPSLAFPQGETDLFKPFGMRPDDAGGRDAYWVRSVARLRPGVDVEQAQADLSRIMRELEAEYPDTNEGIGAFVEPILEFRVGYLRPALAALWGSVTLVLLIACINVANLALARGSDRSRELALRSALGAGRGRLVRLLFAESLLLALAGGACGLGLAAALLRVLPRLAAHSVPRLEEARLDPSALVFTLALSLAAAALFGIAPALQATRSDSLATRTASAGGGRSRLGRSLVVAELALTLCVLAAAGLLFRSLGSVLAIDPGFTSDGLLTMRVEPPQRTQLAQFDGDIDAFLRRSGAERAGVDRFYRLLEDDLVRLPGVEAAAAVNRLPLAGNWWGTKLRIEGRAAAEPENRPRAFARVVTPGYLETLGIPLLAGRTLARTDDGASNPVAVVSRAMADELWPDTSPIGSRFTLSDADDPIQIFYTVVGVVGDIHHASLEARPRPLFYTTLSQSFFGHFGDWGMDLVVRLAPGEPLAQTKTIRSVLRRHAPDLPVFDIRSMNEILGASIAERRFNALLLGLFALLSIVLAAVGLYGVIAYGVSRRAQELGIRQALGASRAGIVGLVVGEGMILVAVGSILGLLAASLTTRWLESELFAVSARDPLTALASVALLLLVGGAACAIPAWRQSGIDPLAALRRE